MPTDTRVGKTFAKSFSVLTQRNSSGFKGRHKNQGNSCGDVSVGSQAKEVLEKIDDKCPTILNIKKYAAQLDRKHDKYERLVKLSRDITIESKRIIFLLHSFNSENKKGSILSEAESRLEALASRQWKSVATELQNEDPYLFHRAFSPGMQEFMEAFLFFYYLKNKNFLHWDYFQRKLTYQLPSSQNDSETSGASIEATAILVPTDYILGLADVTGELMRKCINSIGEGRVQESFETCDIVRSLHSGFLSIGLFGNRDMTHKSYTLRQSLLKMEMVCYNIHVRGSEVPKHMLAVVDTEKTYTNPDEGFFD